MSKPLNNRARLQELSPDLDERGQRSIWVDRFKFWCSIDPLTGRELLAAQQEKSEISHEVEMRFRPGITAAMRIVFKNRIFDIHAVTNPRERNERLKLLCGEGLSDG